MPKSFYWVILVLYGVSILFFPESSINVLLLGVFTYLYDISTKLRELTDVIIEEYEDDSDYPMPKRVK